MKKDDQPNGQSMTRTESEGATLDLPEGHRAFTPGQVIGDRYQILEMLGRGGIGEVWHAFDLKLRVEVALKALREDLFKDERRLEMLRQEVRAAREVMSPNVCRIYDLEEAEGRELVSMEYIDGATLLEVLQDRGPLELKEAQDIASQFLAGLEAIHQAGLVHRDIKPENIMLTRSGRVVVMDFGLARTEDSGAGTVAGTPAYMSPEQAAGLKIDARADVYSAGVVLAEMVSPDGIKSFESRQSIWEGVRSEPAKVPDTPWAPVVKKAVAKERNDRYNSAHTLIRALEDRTFRVEGAEDLHPYPGLASFTEADTEYFFGREADVERLWRKLDRPHLLGIVGPSGSGKTSFIRAGVIPSAEEGWAIATCTPGNAANASLRRALASEIADDSVAVGELAVGDPDSTVSAYSRWRARHDHVLLVVDQFEEVFTLNPAEEQREFAELVERLALEAGVFVLLSMRDDFLMQCRDHESLQPIFSDLTALPTLAGGALRRAIVQPATKCGYRFEDDELVDEILREVEGERGALPLLAFSMARLWDTRDREQGLLTRQAYHDIGGVGGALANHAEATIDRIGSERLPVVRELFRNLVTSEGTRAVRDCDELLSVFEGEAKHLSSRAKQPKAAKSRDPLKRRTTMREGTPSTFGGDPSTRASDALAQDDRRETASDVLRKLVDARLLTSYEVHEEEREPTRRVEIIHESLLANWPRLVGWQTQDADSARMRDELRQAARAWDEHGRHDDRLWTGTAFREYQLWRERYPGGLTEAEEAFAAAMNALAGRRRRRRRTAVAAVLAVAAFVTAGTTALWRQSVLEARRAEAATLVSLGQLELESYPTAAVAHAIASLEQANNLGARNLALKALWKGPTALVATEDFAWRDLFGPDGERLVQTEWIQAGTSESLLSVVRADGAREYLPNAHCETTHLFLSPVTDTGHFVSRTTCADGIRQWVLWSMPEGRPLADARNAQWLKWADDAENNRLVLVYLEGQSTVIEAFGYDGSVKRLGSFDLEYTSWRQWVRNTEMDARNGRWLIAIVDNEVLVFDIDADRVSGPRNMVRIDARIEGSDASGGWLGVLLEDEALMFEIGAESPSEPRRLRPFNFANSAFGIDPLGRFVVTSDADGKMRLWSLTDTSPPVVFEGPPGFPWLVFSDDGSLLEAWTMEENWICWLWSLSGEAPRLLRRFDVGQDGWGGTKWDEGQTRLARWGPDKNIRLWSLDAPADADPLLLSRGKNEQVNDASVHPEGTWLATADGSGLALWPLKRRYPAVIRRHESEIGGLAFAPDGSWVASSSGDGTVKLWPLAGDPPPPGRTLLEIEEYVVALDVSPDGGRILASTMGGGTQVLRPDGGEPRVLEGVFEGHSVALSPDGRLAAAAAGLFGVEERRIAIWDVESGELLTLLEVGEMVRYGLHFTSDGHLLSASESGLLRWDVETGERKLLYAGNILNFVASTNSRRVVMIEREETSNMCGSAVLLELENNSVTRLDEFGEDIAYLALDHTGTVAVTGDQDGEVRVGLVNGGQPHLLVGHEGTIWSVAIDPSGRWVASGSDDQTLRLWPMPDLTEHPLHTLPREELIAKLKTLTNLRVVRDEDSPAGWRLSVAPFPGWETIPTW